MNDLTRYRLWSKVTFEKEQGLPKREVISLLNMDQRENVITDVEPDEEAPEPECKAAGSEK